MNAIQTSQAPAAIGPYSQAIDSGAGLVFVSGQLPIDPATGTFPEGGVQEQTRQSLANASAILEAAGLGLQNVVKTTVFLADTFAFEHCHRSSQKNKRMVLIYLLPVKMLLVSGLSSSLGACPLQGVRSHFTA